MKGKIFISYRHDYDKQGAGRLCEHLVPRYFEPNQVFIDVKTIEPGIDIRGAIKENLSLCQVLIAVIGKHWLASSSEDGSRRLDDPNDAVRLEIATALKRPIPVIPVLLDGTTMPDKGELPDDLKPLASLKAVELSHTRFDKDFDQLIAALEKRLANSNPERNPHELELSFQIPFLPNKHFVGRSPLLRKLHRRLSSDRSIKCPLGLVGLRGIGKTQLAVMYADKYKDAYLSGIYWVNAEDRLSDHIEAIFHQLAGRTDALVILDNLLDPSILKEHLRGKIIPAALSCRLLFTTWRHSNEFETFELEELEERFALNLLLRGKSRRAIRNKAHPQHNDARLICKTLGYLPLALHIAGAHLDSFHGSSLEAYIDELEAQGLHSTLETPSGQPKTVELPTRYELALRAALSIQWDELKDAPDARGFAFIAAHLQEGFPIPRWRLELLSNIKAKKTFFDPVQKAIKQLLDVSLLQQLQNNALRMHSLVREFVVGRLPIEEAPDFKLKCARNLIAAYSDINYLESATHKGARAIEGDLAAGLWLLQHPRHPLGEAREVEAQLRALQRFFRRQSDIFDEWGSERRHFIIQQICNVAIEAGLKPLADDATFHLRQRRFPWLRLAWRVEMESPELEWSFPSRGNKVLSVAISPDGKRAAAGYEDGSVNVWNLDTGEELHRLKLQLPEGAGTHGVGLTGTVDQGYRLCRFTAGWLDVCDLSTIKVLFGWKDKWGDKGYLSFLCASGDGQYFVAGLDADGAGTIGLVFLHDLNGYTEFSLDQRINSFGVSAAIAEHGKRAVVWTGPVLYYMNSSEARMLKKYSRAIVASAVSDHGRFAACAVADTLRIWDLDLCNEACSTHCSPCRAIAFLGEQQALFGEGPELKVWDLETQRQKGVFRSHTSWITAVAGTRDGQCLISGSEEGTVKIWILKGALCSSEKFGNVDRVLALAVAPDGRRVIAIGSNGALDIWDAQTGALLETSLPAVRGHTSAAITSDARHLILIFETTGVLKLWDFANRKTRKLEMDHRWITAISVSADSRKLVAGTYEGMLKIWNLEEGNEVTLLQGDDPNYAPPWHHFDRIEDQIEAALGLSDQSRTGVRAVEFTPDSRYVIAAHNDHRIRKWDIKAGTPIVLRENISCARIVVIPNSYRAIVYTGTALNVWDLESGVDYVLESYANWIITDTIQVDGSGRYATSGSLDRMLRLWDLRTHRECACVALSDVPDRVAFVPKTDAIVVADRVGNIYRLDFERFD